jgi:methyl-accepting chemotaxis protein
LILSTAFNRAILLKFFDKSVKIKIIRDKKSWSGEERRNPARIKSSRIACINKLFSISNLRKRLLIYFGLVVFVTFSIGVQFMVEVGSGYFQKQLFGSIMSQLHGDTKDSFDSSKIKTVLKKLQCRMLLVMLIVLICVIATMFVFIRNIVEPLDLIGKAAQKISNGRLDESVPIRNHDEIGKIGELINDLAANLQEVLLHVWNQTAADIAILDDVYNELNTRHCDEISPEIKNRVKSVRQDIDNMQSMVKAFDLYDIRLNNGKVLAHTTHAGEESGL